MVKNVFSANQSQQTQSRGEPIRTPIKNFQLVPSAGKHTTVPSTRKRETELKRGKIFKRWQARKKAEAGATTDNKKPYAESMHRLPNAGNRV